MEVSVWDLGCADCQFGAVTCRTAAEPLVFPLAPLDSSACGVIQRCSASVEMVLCVS